MIIRFEGDFMDQDTQRWRTRIEKELNEDLRMVGHQLQAIICDEEKAPELFERYYNDGTRPDAGFPGIRSHRGFCNWDNETIVVYYTRYETRDSIEWLLLHEITHYGLRRTWPLALAMAVERENWAREEGYDPEELVNNTELQVQDRIHEADPEEQLANRIATAIKGENYDRKWWRRRQAAIDSREKEAAGKEGQA